MNEGFKLKSLIDKIIESGWSWSKFATADGNLMIEIWKCVSPTEKLPVVFYKCEEFNSNTLREAMDDFKSLLKRGRTE